MTSAGRAHRTVYVIGSAGQVGSALLRSRAVPDGLSVIGMTSADIDITARARVRRALSGLRRGDVVINTAAYTDVDGAESDTRRAYAVNADGPGHLAETVAAAGARLVHLSTDYVFPTRPRGDAGARLPLEPGDLVGDATAVPDSVYGASKLAGETAALAADPSTVIVRTAWVFTGRPPIADFVTTMTRLERDRPTVRVVDDQQGSPTYAPDLAAGLWELVDRLDGAALGGGAVLHASNAGTATWCELARAVFAANGADPARVVPCTTDEFPRPAPRPAYSVLSGASWVAAGLTPLRPWREALGEALAAPS